MSVITEEKFTVSINGQPYLRDCDARFKVWPIDSVDSPDNPDGSEDAVLLSLELSEPAATARFELGQVEAIDRFLAGARYEAFWMEPTTGSGLQPIPVETQFLLIRRSGGGLLLLVPLAMGDFRGSLSGSAEGLQYLLETGDAEAPTVGGPALLVVVGKDPYVLMERAARILQTHFKASLRGDKSVPDFIDLFGWCTWDAFYHEVSAEGVETGLEALAKGGCRPGFMILDDGWQKVKTMPSGEDRLLSFEAVEEKFPGGLEALVRRVKEDFGIQRFLVWHAVAGYWGGVDAQAFVEYGVVEAERDYGDDLLAVWPEGNEKKWGTRCGLIAPEGVDRFFENFYAHLAAAGVDGVKVDNQAVLESLAQGLGGRVSLTQAYRQAIEKAAEQSFGQRLINCMSQGSETLTRACRSTLMRSSTDFWPNIAESHATHIRTNGLLSLWIGQFVQADWDMFQSAHPRAAYHAAARALSGGPVYVSDAPGKHDFELLRQLVFADGSVPRFDAPALPCPRSIFANPEEGPVLLFNQHEGRGVIGIFDQRNPGSGDSEVVSLSVEDHPLLEHDHYAVRAFGSGKIFPTGSDGLRLLIDAGGWEVLTFAPVENGAAFFGPDGMIAAAACFGSIRWISDTCCRLTVKGSGQFSAWTKKPPQRVANVAQQTSIHFHWDDGHLTLDLPEESGRRELELSF